MTEKWVLITGGSSGIGFSFAEKYVISGKLVLIVGRDIKKLEEASQKLIQLGSKKVDFFSCDLSSDYDRKRLFEYCQGRFIFTLVNNVGGSCKGMFTDLPFDDHQSVIDINIVATLSLTHHFSIPMRQKKMGEILIISSFYAFVPISYQSVYSASKAFLLNWGRAFRNEVLQDNVTLTIVTPGLTRTNFLSSSKEKKFLPFLTLEPSYVVHCALDSLKKGKDLCVPGFLYSSFVFLSSFFSWKIISYFVGLANKKRNI